MRRYANLSWFTVICVYFSQFEDVMVSVNLGPYPDQYESFFGPFFILTPPIYSAAKQIIRSAKKLLEKKSLELRQTAEELLK